MRKDSVWISFVELSPRVAIMAMVSCCPKSVCLFRSMMIPRWSESMLRSKGSYADPVMCRKMDVEQYA